MAEYKQVNYKYNINGNIYYIRSNYCPPYNMNKTYSVGKEFKSEIGIPFGKDLFISESLRACFKYLDEVKINEKEL